MTPAEAAEVVRDYRQSRDLIAEAVSVLVDSGQPVNAVAERAGVTREGIYRMRNRFRNGGRDPRLTSPT